jgi:hypothetical protein
MLGLRTATRASFALPAFRNTAARRWSSGVGAKGLEGPADNAFNRERAAVKQHAADTSGKWAWRWRRGIGCREARGRPEEGWMSGVEENGTWSFMGKSMRIKRRTGRKTSGENNMHGDFVEWNTADHWNSTGTWRKLSI